MRNYPKNDNRRRFLQTTLASVSSLAICSSGIVSMLNASRAFANANDDYKALIYIFMDGGNDANNMLVPTGNNELRARYELHRGHLALPEDDLHALELVKPAQIYGGGSHVQFGLHGSCQEMAQLFNQRELSIVCNTGNLVMPTTRQQFKEKSVSLPPQLFSHADQQKQYQSQPTTSLMYGWGGRLAEIVASKNTDSLMSPLVSLSGLNAFQVSKFNEGYVPINCC
jgi:uncharacterized protein (DUF1501 family)